MQNVQRIGGLWQDQFCCILPCGSVRLISCHSRSPIFFFGIFFECIVDKLQHLKWTPSSSTHLQSGSSPKSMYHSLWVHLLEIYGLCILWKMESWHISKFRILRCGWNSNLLLFGILTLPSSKKLSPLKPFFLFYGQFTSFPEPWRNMTIKSSVFLGMNDCSPAHFQFE